MRYFNILCYLIFMILLNMKLEDEITWSWWWVFIPLSIPIIQILGMALILFVSWIYDKSIK